MTVDVFSASVDLQVDFKSTTGHDICFGPEHILATWTKVLILCVVRTITYPNAH
jgi:hypothetical protein